MGEHVAIARCSCGGVARYRPDRLVRSGRGFVQCVESSRPCGKDGPVRTSRDEAVRAWNALRAADWTAAMDAARQAIHGGGR